MDFFSGPPRHLCRSIVVNGQARIVLLLRVHHFAHAGANLITSHSSLNGGSPARSENPRHSGIASVGRLAVGNRKITAGNHNGGYAVIEEHLAEPWLKVNVRIHESGN